MKNHKVCDIKICSKIICYTELVYFNILQTGQIFTHNIIRTNYMDIPFLVLYIRCVRIIKLKSIFGETDSRLIENRYSDFQRNKIKHNH